MPLWSWCSMPHQTMGPGKHFHATGRQQQKQHQKSRFRPTKRVPFSRPPEALHHSCSFFVLRLLVINDAKIKDRMRTSLPSVSPLFGRRTAPPLLAAATVSGIKRVCSYSLKRNAFITVIGLLVPRFVLNFKRLLWSSICIPRN